MYDPIVAILEASGFFLAAALVLFAEVLGRFDKVIAALTRYRLLEFRNHLDELEAKLSRDTEGKREAELAKLFADEYDNISEPKSTQRFAQFSVVAALLVYAIIIILDVLRTDTIYGTANAMAIENLENFLFFTVGIGTLILTGYGFYDLTRLKRKLDELEAKPSQPPMVGPTGTA